MPEIHELPAYGVLVLAEWPNATRPAWFDAKVGWVRIDTEPRGTNCGHMPRVSWDQPAPLSWAPIMQPSGDDLDLLVKAEAPRDHTHFFYGTVRATDKLASRVVKDECNGR